MKCLRIIFADQLSINNPVLLNLNDEDLILFYEPIDTFYEIKHHKQKITFIISAFRHFIETIDHKNIIHHKISKKNKLDFNSYLKKIIKENNITNIVISKPSDYKANKELMFFCQSNNLALEILEDKKFISDADDFANWASDKKTRIQEYYYRWLRKKYNIFMTEENKPIGDKNYLFLFPIKFN